MRKDTAICERLEAVRVSAGFTSLRAFHVRLLAGSSYRITYEATRGYHSHREPPIGYLVAVSRAFGVALDWLATGEEAPSAPCAPFTDPLQLARALVAALESDRQVPANEPPERAFIRVSAGLSVREVAEQSGLSVGTVARLRSGEVTRIHPATRRKIVEFVRAHTAA